MCFQPARVRANIASMLATLRIKNLALVSDLTLELEAGLNVITGETGAGKSVIIGALNLLLGQRADRSLIRAGEETCSVEGVLDVSSLRQPLAPLLEEHGIEPCEDRQLVIKRTFTAAGANRQFVNGSATSLSVLGKLGEWLVDMHGPHDHQSLLRPARQLAMLDAYGHLEKARDAVMAAQRELLALRTSLAGLSVDDRTYAQQVDLLRFQVQEIQQARLREDEEEPLQAEFSRASNLTRLQELSRSTLDLLSEGEGSLTSQAGQLGRLLQELGRLDPNAAPWMETHTQALSLWQDLASDISRYADRLDLDPARVAEMEERLGLIHSLKRKYGGSLAEVIAFGDEAAEKLRRLEGREEEVSRLQQAIVAQEERYWAAGQELSQQRRKVAPKLSKEVSGQLQELGFKQSRFSVAVRPVGREAALKAPPVSGIDDVEFEFAPNPGEPSQALRAIASSGEMARVMLAIKTVLAAQDDVLVLVFDEVDANVGGETAQVVGQKMAKIAAQRQVLCITHLAPVAATAAAHYRVSKQVKNGRTLSGIDRLDTGGRVTELARMLGGQSAAARKHAEDLLR